MLGGPGWTLILLCYIQGDPQDFLFGMSLDLGFSCWSLGVGMGMCSLVLQTGGWVSCVIGWWLIRVNKGHPSFTIQGPVI